MELPEAPAVGRLHCEDRRPDGRTALAARVGYDDLAERRETQSLVAPVEGDDLAPFPAERLWLRYECRQVAHERIARASVGGCSNEHGRLVEQRDERIRVARVDRRLQRLEDGLRVDHAPLRSIREASKASKDRLRRCRRRRS